MCVLYLCFDKAPGEKLLEDSDLDNPDGIGIAWQEGEKVRWVKGIPSIEDAEKTLKKIKLPFMMHFRKASIGGKSPYLTHPFPVTADAEVSLEGTASMVLAHNGHWKNWNDVLLRSALGSGGEVMRKPLSDSRALASLVARHGFGFLDVLDLNDRIAVMDPKAKNHKGEYAPFRTWGTGWLEKDGFWQSSGVMPSKPVTTYPNTWTQNSRVKDAVRAPLALPAGKAFTMTGAPADAFSEEELLAMMAETRAQIHPPIGAMSGTC